MRMLRSRTGRPRQRRSCRTHKAPRKRRRRRPINHPDLMLFSEFRGGVTEGDAPRPRSRCGFCHPVFRARICRIRRGTTSFCIFAGGRPPGRKALRHPRRSRTSAAVDRSVSIRFPYAKPGGPRTGAHGSRARRKQAAPDRNARLVHRVSFQPKFLALCVLGPRSFMPGLDGQPICTTDIAGSPSVRATSMLQHALRRRGTSGAEPGLPGRRIDAAQLS